jgi:hypothetical protein
MTTYTIKCLCGRTSPKAASREAMRAWHAEHKRTECTAHRSGRSGVPGTSIPGTPVRLERHVAADELAATIATVRRLKPIRVDTADSDRWGAPPRGSSFTNGTMGRPGPARNGRFVSSLRNTSFRT